MARAIAYCDRCGKLVSPSKIDQGAAFAEGETAICSECYASMSKDTRVALAAVSAQGDVAAGSSGRSRTTGRRAHAGDVRPSGLHVAARKSGRAGGSQASVSSTSKLLLMSIGIGAVLGLVATAAMMLGSSDADSMPPLRAPQAPINDAPQTYAPVTPAPMPEAPQPVATEPHADTAKSSLSPALAAARAMIDENLSRYEQVRERLEAIAAAQPNSADAEEARKLLEEIDRRHAELADAALAEAKKTAAALAAKAQFDAARSAINYVRPRFGYSKWYDTRGREAIEQALAELERMREEMLASYDGIRTDTLDGKWGTHNGAEFKPAEVKFTPGENGSPARLDFTFEEGCMYVSASKELTEPIEIKKLIWKARGSGCGLGMRIIDSTSQCHQFNVASAVAEEWQEFELTLDKSSESWGGANDRVVHQPIKAVIFNAGRKSDGPGYLEIKDIRLPPQ